MIGLLEVAIYDFRIARQNAAGEFWFGDNGEEIWWTAINAAHRLLTA